MPMPAVPNGTLAGVACTSPTNCFAVGSIGPYGKSSTLIEWWNGYSWQIVTSPKLSGSSELQGISCVSASFCVAAGWRINASWE